ncbi:transcription factor GTE2-like [Humulus lupulus]|uniref:transcription factor GTE2-like n=1 Tax=Humulus lupulus TaxID=3486 RepID=UPI002B41639B|nr:transcription factor GTE2-like [Humulus lupulus]
MASALSASRSEPSWGENKVYMRKYTTAAATGSKKNPLLKFNPNPNLSAVRQAYDSSPAQASGDFPSSNRKLMSLNEKRSSSSSSRSYVTFNLASCSRRDLRELGKRLSSELEQVRALMARIESGDLKSGPGHHHLSQFSTKTTRPSPLQMNHLAESPRAAGVEKRTPKANQNYPDSNFVTGKKKKTKDTSTVVTTTAEKMGSGMKRSNPYGSVMEAKRPTLDPIDERLASSMMKRCGQILTKLMKHKFGWVFNAPVDVVGLNLHDYHQIVKNPMDLGTVKSKLEKNRYRSPIDFASDVRLAFNNAMLYNPKGSDVHVMAEQLLLRFDEMFNPAYKKYENERRRTLGVGAQSIAPESATKDFEARVIAKKPEAVRPQPTFSNSPPPVQTQSLTKPSVPATPSIPTMSAPVTNPSGSTRPMKLPKPKAKDPNKRQMSDEEKAKLGANLQNLPQEKMGQLVQILKKRSDHLSQDGDEIELDIEAVDTETLWELDRFVSNYKKFASKIKRQSLIQTPIPAPQNNNQQSLVTETPEAATVKSKKIDTAEEDIDIGEDIPMGNFPPVVIEKDTAGGASSGSSSSGSSSSSSDSSSSSGSDSGSSSGSESEADSVQSPFVASKEAPAPDS